MFSSRLPAALAANAISRAVAEYRTRLVGFIDLTETNPTKVGLSYPPEMLHALADPKGLTYDPDPLGLLSARMIVASVLASQGIALDPQQIVLTASTSEAYSVLFKLLADAGDEVLVPQPSYPLFDSLTALEGVASRPYRLEFHGRWTIDRESLERAATDRTKAVLVVSPNNPTGSMLRRDDREWLATLAARRGWAVISDEVFADYPLRPAADASSFGGDARALTFVLGGLSKSAGLPQLKLGWISVTGPGELVHGALERLAIICDTYLSVSTPVQVALPAILSSATGVREAIRARVEGNLRVLEKAVQRHSAITLLPPEGGWSAVLRVPSTSSEEELVLRLLGEGVLVHPGFFFDFEEGTHLVVSLLPDSFSFDQGVHRVLTISTREGLR
jgi:aspartate/methionine/tyrosine aminotransferase